MLPCTSESCLAICLAFSPLEAGRIAGDGVKVGVKFLSLRHLRLESICFLSFVGKDPTKLRKWKRICRFSLILLKKLEVILLSVIPVDCFYFPVFSWRSISVWVLLHRALNTGVSSHCKQSVIHKLARF